MQHKLYLVKEGKMSASELIDQSTAVGTPAPRFDIANNLKLLTKFNDKSQIHSFVCLSGWQILEIGLIRTAP